ncbi:flavin reductase [Pseudomonas typographi]|uniref:FMN reductase (NADH) RutF n=1 Tax=Pseudomonas typographi TaxID=2715964 RepID=A0ABR7Z2V7_9PSED|nr:flavin reductase [Pseudomonas typographi]MBD1550323.1 FMN reductase [Pseudomonas typographi]MBD1585911.1 FMN reductase [Pseudomonas typographi]MBD1599723.1 FMN reductase [Pseudomonas typographi]
MIENLPVTIATFRDAMARLGAAVHVVTSAGTAGATGFTATAVCSVTDTPPTLLVCLNRNASAYAAVVENGVLCVNTLASTQQALSQAFGGKTLMAERFAHGQWTTLQTGAPVLHGAIANFDCRIVNVLQIGTHDVLICEAVAILSETESPGLLYVDRNYHSLHTPNAGDR